MNENKTNINWYPGHMAKTKRLISENINLIDLVYEVVDARMPYSSKIKDIDTYIKSKPRILVMTKTDLCDMKETNKWVKYYESKGYKVVLLDLEHNKNLNELYKATDMIMEDFNKKNTDKGLLNRRLRILIVGIPNAGKSTLINRLVGKKATNVGNMPGVTKNLSWIRINKDIELLDSPGVLWPKFEDQNRALILASFLSIKEEILNSDQIACFILTKIFELYPEKLKERYGLVSLDEDFIDAYETIGKKRGALSKGGSVDYDRVSNIIIRDLNNGYFGDITLDR